MHKFIIEAEQKLAEQKQLAEQLLLEKYLKMVGVAKHDFSNAFRKHLNIATGLNMDTDLTTQRIFNPSETKIARTLIDELQGDKDILYIIRSRSSSESEEKEVEQEPEVKESIASIFEKKLNKAPEEKPEEKPESKADTPEEEFKKVRDFASDGHSKSGDISDEDAEGVIDNTELEHFFILTNIVRLGKRISPEMQTPPAMHLMMINNLEGTEDKPLKVEVVNATLSVLVELLKKNTSTVNFVYKLLAKPEHAQHLKVNLDVDSSSDNGELQKQKDPKAVDDSDDATADELETDGADQPKEVTGDEEKPEEDAEEKDSEDEESEEDEDDATDKNQEPKKKASQSSQIFQKMEGLELGAKYSLNEDVGYMKDGEFHIDMRNGAIVELTDLMNEGTTTVKVKHIASRQEITVSALSLVPVKVGG